MVKQTAECRGKSQPTQSGCWPMGSERIQTAVFSYLSKPSSCCQQPSQATWLRQKIGSGQAAAYGKRHVAGLLLDNEWTQLASTRKTELGIATRLLLGREPSQAFVPPVGIRAKPSSWAACWHQSQAKQLGRLLASEPSQAAGPLVGIRAKPSSWTACWHQSQAKQLGRLLETDPSQAAGPLVGKRAKPSRWAATWEESQAKHLGRLLATEPSSLASCWQQSQAKQLGCLLATKPSQAAGPPVGNRAKPSSCAACWQRSQAKQLGRERQGCRMWSVCWDDRAGWQNKQQTVPNVNRNVNRWYAGLLYPPLGKQIQIFRGREEKKEKSLNFQPCA